MTLNHKYFKEKSFVMSLTLKFLLWLEKCISFIKDIVQTFRQIIKIKLFLLIKSDLHDIGVKLVSQKVSKA